MTTSGVLCIDIGTSSLKSGIVSVTGKVTDVDREPVSLDECRKDADAWTRALDALARRLQNPHRVDGIAVSGNGPTVVPADRAGSPVAPPNLWLDDREIRVEGESSYFLPKIAWYKRRLPEAYEKTRWFLSCPEFIEMYLTGAAATVVPTEEFRPSYWTSDSIEAYDVDSDKLPPTVSPGTKVGDVRRDLAQQWGLRAGVPVYAAGPDFLMSLIGTATTVPGRTCDRAGTSEGINYCSARKVEDPRVRTLPHAIPGFYNVAGILASTGRLFEWLREITGQKERPYIDMLKEIRDVRNGDIPTFFSSLHSGARWEFSSGVFVGLGADHGPAEIGRAVVEAIGFSVREGIEILESIVGGLRDVRACGGQAKNGVWNQMKANITGKVIRTPEVLDAELIGNACTAYLGRGEYHTLQEASEAMVRLEGRYEPDAGAHAYYGDRYKRYLEAQTRIREPMVECSELLSRR
jgi:xylulokinase